MKNSFYIYLLLSILSGVSIAYIDSQPDWDDTGITVLLILVGSALFGYLANKKPWIIGLAISIWIPVWAIVSTHNYGGFLALVPGFAGAYAGYYGRKLLTKN